MYSVSLAQSQVDRMNAGLHKVKQKKGGVLVSNHGTGVAPTYFLFKSFSLEEAVEGHVDDAKL